MLFTSLSSDYNYSWLGAQDWKMHTNGNEFVQKEVMCWNALVNENHKITEYDFFHHMLCTNVIQYYGLIKINCIVNEEGGVSAWVKLSANNIMQNLMNLIAALKTLIKFDNYFKSWRTCIIPIHDALVQFSCFLCTHIHCI